MKENLIGIDCTKLKKNYKGGINTFTLGLLEAIEKSNYHSKFLIICSFENINFFKKFKKIKIIRVRSINFISKYFLIFFSIFKLEKFFFKLNKLVYQNFNKKFNNKLTSLYIPTSTVNNYFFKKKNILSPHDLQHVYYPENFNLIRRKYREFNFKQSLIHCDFIQVSSNFIKSNILETYPKIKKDKIIKINECVNLDFFKPPKKIRKEKIIFFPAYCWPHKNHKFIISCFKKIIYELNIECRLVMCGGNFNLIQKFFNKITKDSTKKIIHLGLIDSIKLKKLYQKSTLVLSASTYESSSLPILEAAACGTAVMASDIKPNIELSKNINLNLYKLNNEKSFIRVFLKIWENKLLREKNIKDNLNRIKRYNWLNFVNDIRKIDKLNSR